MVRPTDLQFMWCDGNTEIEPLMRMFLDNISAEYISHSELQGKRAISRHEWADDIDAVIRDELLARTQANPSAHGQEQSLMAVLSSGTRIIGILLVDFRYDSQQPYCIIEDMIIDKSERGGGYGAQFMRWIVSECENRGIHRLFLESGINNERAHTFFENQGFNPVSVVMMKEI